MSPRCYLPQGSKRSNVPYNTCFPPSGAGTTPLIVEIKMQFEDSIDMLYEDTAPEVTMIYEDQ